MLAKIKPYMMPIAMAVGALFFKWLGTMAFLTPYLIFIMLFLTYCKLDMENVRLSWLHLWLLGIQFGVSLCVYFILLPANELLAQGVLICVLAPTGTAAPVVTGMLKGNVASITAYSLISNMLLALAAPVIFSFIGTNHDLPFMESFLLVAKRVGVLLLLPFALALTLGKASPRVKASIGNYSGLSFYLWTFSLSVVTARTVQFVSEQEATTYTIEMVIGIAAAIACIGQFIAGRAIGKHYNDTVAGGQSIGQKNTILAIWMAQTYLNPIASIGPGAYVLWQNMVNSYQVWLKRKSL
ncbi:MAG TPA: hypothetical protein VK152_10165 [Paludibacter sp.]|nr:hypothetical protein [Paludibacter sp.]